MCMCACAVPSVDVAPHPFFCPHRRRVALLLTLAGGGEDAGSVSIASPDSTSQEKRPVVAAPAASALAPFTLPGAGEGVCAGLNMGLYMCSCSDLQTWGTAWQKMR